MIRGSHAAHSARRRWRPSTHGNRPVLLIHGDDDRNVSFIESINLIIELRKRKVDVEQLLFPDEVHDFLRHQNWVKTYKATADFFNRKPRNRKTTTETQRA
jgi:dipeptidyl aminopeptidase/acylaminoacyl peptidase